MKKRILFVGAMMCLAVGAMFVSCGDSKKSSKSGEDGSASVAGCTCDITTEGETVTMNYDATEMKGYKVSSCTALETAIKQAALQEGIKDAKVSCRVSSNSNSNNGSGENGGNNGGENGGGTVSSGGCKCTVSYGGQSTTHNFTKAEVSEAGATSCSGLANLIVQEAKAQGISGYTATCTNL